MAKKKKTTFVFDLEWHDAIQELPCYERLAVYEAICHYARHGTLPEGLDSGVRMALRLIGMKMDENRRVYDEKCESMENARRCNSKHAGHENGIEINSEKIEINKNGIETNSENTEINKNGIEINSEKIEINKSGIEINSENAEISKSGIETKSENSEINKSGIETNSEKIEIKSDNDSDNDNIYSLPLAGAHGARVREELLALFFGKQITLESYLRRWETTPEELRQMCDAVLDDWAASGQTHLSEDDARQHFVSAVRYQFEKKIREQNEKSRKSGRASSRRPRAGSEEPGYGLVD